MAETILEFNVEGNAETKVTKLDDALAELRAETRAVAAGLGGLDANLAEIASSVEDNTRAVASNTRAVLSWKAAIDETVATVGTLGTAYGLLGRVSRDTQRDLNNLVVRGLRPAATSALGLAGTIGTAATIGSLVYTMAALGAEASSAARQVQELSNYFDIESSQGFRLRNAFGDGASSELLAAFNIRQGIQQDSAAVSEALERIGVSVESIEHADLPSVLFAINQAVRDSKLPVFELDMVLRELGITNTEVLREANLATSHWAEEHQRQIGIVSTGWNNFIGFFQRIPGQLTSAATEIGNLVAFGIGAAVGANTIPTQEGLTAGGPTGVGLGNFDPNFRLRVGDQFYGTPQTSTFTEAFRTSRVFRNPITNTSGLVWDAFLGAYVPEALANSYNPGEIPPSTTQSPITASIGGGGGLGAQSERAFDRLTSAMLDDAFTDSLKAALTDGLQTAELPSLVKASQAILDEDLRQGMLLETDGEQALAFYDAERAHQQRMERLTEENTNELKRVEANTAASLQNIENEERRLTAIYQRDVRLEASLAGNRTFETVERNQRLQRIRTFNDTLGQGGDSSELRLLEGSQIREIVGYTLGVGRLLDRTGFPQQQPNSLRPFNPVFNIAPGLYSGEEIQDLIERVVEEYNRSVGR